MVVCISPGMEKAMSHESVSSQIDMILLNPEIYRYNMELYRYYFAINTVKDILEQAAEEKIAVYGGYALSHIWEKITPGLKEKVKYIIETETADTDPYDFKRVYIRPDEADKYDMDLMILAAYKDREKMKNKISAPGRKVIDLYEILFREKINMEEDYYKGVHYSYGYVIQDLHTLKSCDKKLRVLLLKKLIGEYFHIRDFENAFAATALLCEMPDSGCAFYQELEQKIRDRLSILSKTVSAKKHIVVNWLDAVPPKAAKQMPFLKSKIQEGIWFENAHTVVKHTKPTMKTIFTGGTYIDDRLFLSKMDDLENSRLYKKLRETGYRFQYFGGYMRYGMFQNGRTIPYIRSTDHFLLACMPLQWAAVKELEECGEKCFFLIHNLAEGHEFLNGDMALPEEERITEAEERRETHKNTSYRYLDRQLRFYTSLYRNLAYQIIMSDHGVNDGTVPDDWREFTHVILLVLGEDIKAEKVGEMASLVSFPDLADCLIKGESGKIARAVSRDFVLVQTEDMYNMHAMESVYTDLSRFEASYMQRRGVITLQDAFYKKATGEEFYFPKGSMENSIRDPSRQKRINEVRQIAGNQFIDFTKYEKYFGSKRMYELLGYTVADEIELI